MENYILDIDNNPIKATFQEWIDWQKKNPVETTRVGLNYIPTTNEPIKISTVFLGFNHNWIGGPPLLWETMIFGGEQDGYQERYSSYQEAIVGHLEALDIVRTAMKKPND